ncbi:MAG: PEGA domain-containing protein [Deltaproteobacteria bacterium]|nr:PEGA domain-containing protein [Deltaproteobacteria bacterium]
MGSRGAAALLIVGALVVGVGAPSLASAADPAKPTAAGAGTLATLERKKKAFDAKARGDAAMQALRFSEALEAYDAAYALEPGPALLYNRGRALQLLDRMPEALEAFEQFQREAPPDLLQKVAKLDELLAEVRSKVATLNLSLAPEGVEVLVDGRAAGTGPLASPLRLNRKDGVVLALRKEGYHSVERRLDFSKRPEQELSVTLQPKDTTAVLVATSPVAGAFVRIDGRSVGNAPSESYLQPGGHRVVVGGEGYEDAEVAVTLAKGERKTVDVPLKPTTPLYKRWWLWSAVGAAVVTGVTLGVVLTTERAADSGTIEPGQISAPLVTF